MLEDCIEKLKEFEDFTIEILRQYENCIKPLDPRVLHPDVIMDIAFDNRQKIKFLCTYTLLSDTELELSLFDITKIKDVVEAIEKKLNTSVNIEMNKSTGCINIKKKSYIDVDKHNEMLNFLLQNYKNKITDKQRPIKLLINELDGSQRSKQEKHLKDILDNFNRNSKTIRSKYSIH